MDAKGNFVKDPLTGHTLDFESPSALILGGKALPYCFSKTVAAAPIDPAIEKCLAQAGSNPFGKNPSYSVLDVSGSGTGNSNIHDSIVSTEPRLVLVKGVLSGAGDQTINLNDPNAYYCMDIVNSGTGNTSFNYNSKAKILTSKAITSGTGILNILPKFR